MKVFSKVVGIDIPGCPNKPDSVLSTKEEIDEVLAGT